MLLNINTNNSVVIVIRLSSHAKRQTPYVIDIVIPVITIVIIKVVIPVIIITKVANVILDNDDANDDDGEEFLIEEAPKDPMMSLEPDPEVEVC